MEANGKVSERFSRRTGWDLREGGLAAAIREARAQRREPLDLTVSNPTVCGFQYDTQRLLAALGDVGSMTYEPDARGLASARSTVGGYYAEHGATMNPADLVLTTSTSEAYSYLFRLLCDAGDEVLVAQPGYPLFDFLADLDDVRLVGYPLFYDYGWWIDLAELERRITPRSRALVLVHPNNPTGHATGAIERQRLEEICLRHGLALVVDEVFLDFGLGGKIESFAVGSHPVLTFVVSGLSKILGLPQMKVGWVGCFGPGREEALRRLEVIADTFLSVSAPVQHALPVWLAGRAAIQGQILDRVRANLEIASDAVEVLPVEAGWSAVLRLPWAATAEELVGEAGVIVHPGSFYGMEGRNRVVVSLLGRVETMREGMRRLREFFES